MLALDPQTLGFLTLLVLAAVAVRLLFRNQQNARNVLASFTPGASRISSRIFRIAAERSTDGIVLQDMNARVIWANPAYFRIMGRPPEQIIGHCALDFALHPDDRPSVAEIESFRFDPTSDEFLKPTLHRNSRPNGQVFWAQLTMSLVDLEDAELDGQTAVLVSCRDVSEQIEREARLKDASRALEHSASHDPLTGLANRSAVLNFGDHALGQGNISGQPTGLLHLDLDRFKEVNDRHGHDAGDALLQHAANVLTKTVRRGDLVGRIGGDEFVVVCPGVTALDDLNWLGQKIIASLAAPMPWGDGTIQCAASIGAAISTPDMKDPRALIAMADSALYEVKRAGRGDVAAYDEGLHRRQQARQQLQSEFAVMLSANEMEFRFQPLIDYENSQLLGFEAIACWHHPKIGEISPDVFLPMAIEMNLMHELDLAAMHASTRNLATLRAAELETVVISFNASSETLAQESFVNRLAWELDRLELPPDSIAVEVQENAIVASSGAIRESEKAIARLKELGVRVALDDFGVGYAGLAHLAQLDFNGVKTDPTLLQNIAGNPSRRKIFDSIVSLCDSLDIRIIAKGVDDDAMAKTMQNLGCKLMQGRVAAPPMPADALVDWIKTSGYTPVPAAQDPNPGRLAS